MGYSILGRGSINNFNGIYYNIFCRPFNYNNIIYSLQKNKPCYKYSMIYSVSNYPGIYLTDEITFPFNYNFSGAGNKYAKERLWYSNDLITGGSSLVSVQISGKRVFNANSRALGSYDRCSLPITFFSNGIEFHAIRFCSSHTSNIDNSSNFVDGNISSIDATIVQFIKPNGTAINAITTSGWNYSALPDDTVDFGTLPQDVTQDFRTWLLENSTPEKTAKITIKNKNTTLVESGLIAPYSSITLSTINNVCTLTTNNGDTLSFNVPNNFAGLSTVKTAIVCNIPDGQTTSFSSNEPITLYISVENPMPIPSTFKLKLYVCTAENNRIDKTNYLSKETEFSITLKDEADLLEMELNIDMKGKLLSGWTYPKWNYAYIENFNRYYYVTSRSVHQNVWAVNLKVDTLMSWKTQISGLAGFLDRSENANNEVPINKYFADDNIIADVRPIIETSNLSTTWNFKNSGLGYLLTGIYNIEGDNRANVRTAPSDFSNIRWWMPSRSAMNYMINDSNLRDLMQYLTSANWTHDFELLFKDNNGCVGRILQVPFNWDQFINTSTYSETVLGLGPLDSIQISNIGSGTEDVTGYLLGGSDGLPAYAKYTSFHLTPSYNSFLDYEPYVKVLLYIPKFNPIELSMNRILNKDIDVYISFDYVGNVMTCFIMDGANVITSVSSEIGVEQPFGYTNSAALASNAVKGSLQSLASACTYGLAGGNNSIINRTNSNQVVTTTGNTNSSNTTTVNGSATMPVTNPNRAKGYSQIKTPFTAGAESRGNRNFNKTVETNRTVTSERPVSPFLKYRLYDGMLQTAVDSIMQTLKGSYANGGSGSLINCSLQPTITIIRTNYSYPQNFAHYYGYPVKRYVNVSDLIGSGYNEFAEIHVHPFEGITYDECSEIENALMSGVYL